MESFDGFRDRIEKDVRATRRMAMICLPLYMGGVVVVLGFVGWVIVKLMQHFGVL